MDVDEGEEVVHQVQAGEDHTALCLELVSCMTKILDPLCPQAERAACNQRIEDFKEHSPYCLQCGFQLAQEQNSVVRHLGLQLMEHFVKYNWNSLQQNERQNFRMQLLQFLSSSVLLSEQDEGQDEGYVKESMARVTVETAKKMWPQHWDSFIPDLLTLTQCGPTQVELVFLVFRRLAEDIHLYESGLTNLRKREMTAALNQEVESVFIYLLQSLESPLAKHLTLTAMNTVTVFSEWLEFDVLLMEDCRLLVLLYNFINCEELKTAACECLAVILSRKGDLKKTYVERLKLLELLSRDSLTAILQASIKAHSMEVVEKQYVFLKRVCQVLVHLGSSQLAQLWNTAAFPVPESFELYLQVMLDFTKHPSQVLCRTSAEVWSQFLTHNFIKENPILKDFLPNVLGVVKEKLMKFGDPTLNNHVCCKYSRMDFDGVDEYTVFFSRYRSMMTRLVSIMAPIIPRTTAKEALSSVQKLVQQQPKEVCGKTSMLYLEWEGFWSFIESWTATFKQDPKVKEVVKETGLEVIAHILAYEVQDPMILYCQFRCLHTGVVAFLEYDQNTLQSYLQKVFSCITLLANPSELPITKRCVILARSMIASCLIYVCDMHGQLLQPFLQQLYDQYRVLIRTNALLYCEKNAFIEAFIILGQLKSTPEQQSAFFGELLQEVTQLFQEMQGDVTSPESLVKCLGLHLHPCDAHFPKTKRADLNYVTSSVLNVLKKSQRKPLDQATIVPQQHPTYQHIMPLLVKFTLPLINTLYQLWSRKSKPLLSDHFQSIHDLHPYERAAVMGLTTPPSDGDSGYSQLNLSYIHDQCLQSLHFAYATYGFKHLCEIGFIHQTVEALFTNPSDIHLWRVKSIIHVYHVTDDRYLKVTLSDDQEGSPQTGHVNRKLHCSCLVSMLCQLAAEFREPNYWFTKITIKPSGYPLEEVIDMVIEKKYFLLPMVKSCPEDCWESVLTPILYKAGHLIMTRLQSSWNAIIERQPTVIAVAPDWAADRVGESEVSKEVLEEQVTSAVSREYASLLEIVCVKRVEPNGGRRRHRKEVQSIVMDDEMEDVSSTPEHDHCWSNYEILSPLAAMLIQVQPMTELLFISAFSGMTWNDTLTVGKCCNVAGVLSEKALVGSFSTDIYEQLFTQVLMGLQRHGSHEHTRSQLSMLALMIYEATIHDSFCNLIAEVNSLNPPSSLVASLPHAHLPAFMSLAVWEISQWELFTGSFCVTVCPGLQQVLSQLPGSSQGKVEAFTQLLENEKTTIKKKREKFRDLIAGVVGKYIGETFKKPVAFDLPEMEFKKKAKETREIDFEEDVLTLFEEP